MTLGSKPVTQASSMGDTVHCTTGLNTCHKRETPVVRTNSIILKINGNVLLIFSGLNPDYW